MIIIITTIRFCGKRFCTKKKNISIPVRAKYTSFVLIRKMLIMRTAHICPFAMKVTQLSFFQFRAWGQPRGIS